MKKSILFLINGLGIEKAGSYSISIDQCMPRLAHTKETSFYTTAITNSLEYRTAYQNFFLGDTYALELNYIKEKILGDNLKTNPIYNDFVKNISVENTKLHIFVEPTNDKVVNEINELVNTLTMGEKKEVYLHLILSQLTVNEYSKLINTVNYIKYHLNTHITVGFIIGKDNYNEEMTKDEMDIARKLLFFCSAERWSDTDKKLLSLKEANIRPCEAPGFCATTSCFIGNNDTILFFNTRSTTYDKFINAIIKNAPSALKNENYNLPLYSIIKLDTKYNIPSFANNVVYENSLSNMLQKANKKSLIFCDEKNISYINFLANGLNYVNNPNIQFMKNDISYLSNPVNIKNIIDNTDYNLIIFDFHMDVSKTINDLKAQLEQIDVIIGNITQVTENKHSLLITSLYGVKKTLPLADYNQEMVTIDYEMQIPIFFFDYTYPRSKYVLFPGETNDILNTAISFIWNNPELYSLVKQKGILNNLLGALKKK